jgi:hypothetical protein
MPERSSKRQLAFSLRRLGIVPVIAIAAGIACGDRSPTQPAAPSPTAPTAPTPAPVPPAAKRIVGRVLDTSDTPVPGASLTFNTFRGPMTVMSDAAGSFDVTVDTWISGLDVVMEKPGYERSGRWISVGAAGEVVHDLRLHRIVRVAAGDSLRLSIRPDDPTCGFDFEFLCRTVRITAASAGRLTAQVVPDRAGTQLGLALSSDFIPRLSTSPLSMEVTAFSETSVNVLAWWQQADEQPFTLITSLNP